MELADGTIISESTAIARYLAKNREGFWGKNLFEEAQVDQWASIATKDIHNKTLQYLGKILFNFPVPQA
jgi:glutathione S-transferase